jgi:hypothetical protein
MEQYRLPQIDILKIDIKGAETAVFEAPGCHAWLPRVRVLLIELHDHLYPGSEQTFLEAINQYECTARISGENIIFELPDPANALGPLELPRHRYS